MTSPYNAVSYESGCHPQSHPDRLAVIGTLFGLQPTPISNCRVLDLGCSDGANVIPLAAAFPQSEFVGIDLAEDAIAHGHRTIDALKLANIRLEAANIMALSPDLGAFDYILVHGLFSWVDEEVREKIFSLCRDHLAPNGVAYISYNAYPGYHMREIARDIMRLHARNLAEPADQIRQGKALVQFLAQALPDSTPYGGVLKAESADIQSRLESVLFHDDLSDNNQPFYFCDFLAYAAAFGLRYLGEADYADMLDTGLPEPVRQLLARAGDDVVSREQMMDFARGRRFRQTLLCHGDVKLRRQPNAEAIEGLFIGAATYAPDFREPSAKPVLHLLSTRWPELYSFEDLLAASGLDRSTLRTLLLHAYGAAAVEFHMQPPPCVAAPGEFPKAANLARWQASQGLMITTLNYQRMRLEDPISRFLLTLLDGSRDRTALLAGLRQFIEAHIPASDPSRTQLLEQLPRLLEQSLANWAGLGLLEK